VVVVASVHAVGDPIAAETVHRPERVAELADVDVGAELTAAAMARVLGHADGGLKGVPASAECVVLLNMVDDRSDEATAGAVADGLDGNPEIDRVVLARMNVPEVVTVR
jgi:probable selenium-dependent hydroxylase accessory protein YqeC